MAGGSYIGGAERATLSVLNGLKREGYTLHIVPNGFNDGKFIRHLIDLNLDFTAIKLGWYYISRVYWSLVSLLNYPKAVFDFLIIKRNFRPNFVYTTSFRPIVLLYPFIGNDIVYHVHDASENNRQSKFFLRLIDSKVRKYIAVSHFIKNDLIRCGISEDKIDVIHNGIDPDSEVVSRFILSSGALRVGLVGQIIPRKGHEDAILALKIIIDQGIDIKLFVVGSGDLEYILYLKQVAQSCGVSKSIFWKGFRSTRREIYEEIDVVLAPTRDSEPFGLIAIEAGSLAIPCIGTNRGGFLETIVDGFNGYVVDPRDPGQIASKLSILSKDRKKLEILGSNSFEHFEKHFTSGLMTLRIAQLFDSLSAR